MVTLFVMQYKMIKAFVSETFYKIKGVLCMCMCIRCVEMCKWVGDSVQLSTVGCVTEVL